MTTTEKVKAILKIARANKKGFTIDRDTLAHIPEGWCIGVKETQDSFGEEGLRKVLQVAEEKDLQVGGWGNGNKYYFDAVMIVEGRDEAIRLAIENEQLSIYNLGTFEYIEF